jgi:hypothetical protein
LDHGFLAFSKRIETKVGAERLKHGGFFKGRVTLASPVVISARTETGGRKQPSSGC